jgi:hypothetical protein
MTFEKPKVWIDIQFGYDMSLSVRTSIVTNFKNAIHHEHWWLWKLGIPLPKKSATRAL